MVVLTGAMLLAAATTAKGIVDLIQSRRAADIERPDMPIPKSALEAVKSAELISQQSGLLSDPLREILDAKTAERIGDIREISPTPSVAAGAIQQLDLQSKTVLKEAELQDIVLQLENKQNLQQMQQLLSRFEFEKIKFEEIEPFGEQTRFAREKQTTGLMDLFGGLALGVGSTKGIDLSFLGDLFKSSGGGGVD